MKQRPRSTHEKTFQELLNKEAQRFKDEAAKIPHGTARDLLLQRAFRAEAASHLDRWLSSPGLQPPK